MKDNFKQQPNVEHLVDEYLTGYFFTFSFTYKNIKKSQQLLEHY